MIHLKTQIGVNSVTALIIIFNDQLLINGIDLHQYNSTSWIIKYRANNGALPIAEQWVT
jgi:hypothetical protein